MPDPLYNEIDASNLESVRKNVVFDNLFVDTPFQAKLRAAGCLDSFLGGNGMVENFLYGRAAGAAVTPGSTITITRGQLNTAMKFFPKAYASWFPYDDWEMDDGSGTGGVINSGPTKVVDTYQLFMESMTMTINTMLEMDSFRHGQPNSATVADNRQTCSNGLSEALNNGIDPSWDGNIFPTYGGDLRNGAIGNALNSTPLYLGTVAGNPGQVDFNALMQLWGQCSVTGGNPDLGVTNTFGFVAIANALDAQRRDVSSKNHDIKWTGLHFNGVDIFQDPLAPSAQAVNFLQLAPAGGSAGSNNLADGTGNSTQVKAFTTPQFTLNGANVPFSPTGSNLPSNTVIQPGEVLFMLETTGFKLRPTDKKGWNFGLRRAPMPNNISIDAIMMRLGTNLYQVMPRHCGQMYGFKS